MHPSRDPSSLDDVSVVIPHYERPDLLRDAIVSALGQTVAPREVIVVDDGSTDPETIEGLREMEAEFSGKVHIHFLPTNGGPSRARNAGWDLATSEYVAFLDCDDTWHPQKLELQLYAMRHHDSIISCHGAASAPHPPMPTLSALKYVRLRSVQQLLWRSFIATSSVVIRRDVPQRFDTDMSHGEDFDLWVRVAEAGPRILYVDLPLYARRADPSGTAGLSGNLSAMFSGHFHALREMRRRGTLSPLPFTLIAVWTIARFGRLRLRRLFA